MTRQGVTQHLDVLEAEPGGRAVARAREIALPQPRTAAADYDRWIRKFERPRLRVLRDLKHRLEDDAQ